VIIQVLSYAVDDQMQQLVLFVEKKCDGQVPNLLFRVFGAGHEVDGFEMAKIDVPSENVNIE